MILTSLIYPYLKNFYPFYFNPLKLFIFLSFYLLLCLYGSQLPVFLLRRVPFGHLGFFNFVFFELEEDDLELDLELEDFDFNFEDFFEEL